MDIFSKFSKVAVVTAMITVALVIGVTYAQQSYPLTCRGGGNMTITSDGNNVRISFLPGQGAAPQGLSPGQCTWSDRAFRPGEPTTICDNSARAASYVGQLIQGQYVILKVYNDGHGCMKVTGVGP
jgi:gamma-glutamyltranspeptidase